ncbi:cation diffusion facilitator family transporter [Candidatus Oleimmundimicrobium sp.]|uniref:cation diffusion facilitator family transporter n=1 Tax=Candidatus Oleimmundimicrobium sp. TaxID=3060597 RepID=UPI002728FC91|nr:cation diffusion facilitator family transporter [Candidatus Oleimmundimicrobium sp.]MDO8886241.1 cation diffusion facilitator family transporter [Candidatus Oleimmundimicrobium sp.]
MQHEDRFILAGRAARLGIYGNLGLAFIKLFAGIVGRSQAVIADAVNTLSDIITDVVTILSLKIAKKPIDTKHPYGHGKVEAISAFLVGLFIIVTGVFILFSAARSVFTHSYVKPELIALLAAFLTVLAKERMFRYVYKIGREINSPAVMAKARDHRSDVLASFSVIVGVTAARLGYPIFDPIAAGLVSFFIIRIGYFALLNASRQLMDTLPEESTLREITLISEEIKGVEHVHEVKARYAGQFLLVDIKVEADPKITVAKGHDIAVEVRRRIMKKMDNVDDVLVHINPYRKHLPHNHPGTTD